MQDGRRLVAVCVRDHDERGSVGIMALGDWVCGHASVAYSDEPVRGVVVQGLLNGSFLHAGGLHEVFDYVVDVGGAVLHHVDVDEVPGPAAGADHVLGCSSVSHRLSPNVERPRQETSSDS